MLLLINFIAFQIGWFSSVIGAANQMPWLGPLVLLFVLAIHLRMSSRPTSELLLIISCGVVGIIFDSLLVASGWVAYPAGQVSVFLAPYWIVTMWMLFGTTLNVSMAWLKGRPALAAVLGAIGGPASYIAGQKLGGIILVDYLAAITALAIGWAIFMPLLLTLAEKLDLVASKPATQEARSS